MNLFKKKPKETKTFGDYYPNKRELMGKTFIHHDSRGTFTYTVIDIPRSPSSNEKRFQNAGRPHVNARSYDRHYTESTHFITNIYSCIQDEEYIGEIPTRYGNPPEIGKEIKNATIVKTSFLERLIGKAA